MTTLKAILSQYFSIIEDHKLEVFESKWDKTINLKRNDYLITEGSIENYIYFIEEGTFCITFLDNDEDIVMGFGYPNTFLFSPSILNGKPTEQSVKAIKKAKLRAIHKDVFFNFIYNDEALKSIWYKEIEKLLFAQMDRQIDLLISSPKERLDRLLKRSPHVFQLIPNKYIASYLRMTPETLSRIKS